MLLEWWVSSLKERNMQFENFFFSLYAVDDRFHHNLRPVEFYADAKQDLSFKHKLYGF